MRFALVGCSNFCDRPLIYCVVADKIGQVRGFLVTKIVTYRRDRDTRESWKLTAVRSTELRILNF